MKHYIIRVGNGNNFYNSVYNVWGYIDHSHNLKITKKMEKGDVLWFLKSKEFGGNFVGMATFERYIDRRDETLINVNTLLNNENNWTDDDGNETDIRWDIQIHYRNLYQIEELNIVQVIVASLTVMEYEASKTYGTTNFTVDLEQEYRLITRYRQQQNKQIL